jgi:hypothetical protein
VRENNRTNPSSGIGRVLKALCFQEEVVAVWQVPIQLIPERWVEYNGHNTESLYDEDGFCDPSETWKQNQPTKKLDDVFGKILPLSSSSDDEALFWGSDKKHDISAWYEDNLLVSLGLRIDMREPIDKLLVQIITAAQELNCQLFIQGQRIIIKPSIFDLKKSILKSNAAKFVDDPEGFLRSEDFE